MNSLEHSPRCHAEDLAQRRYGVATRRINATHTCLCGMCVARLVLNAPLPIVLSAGAWFRVVLAVRQICCREPGQRAIHNDARTCVLNSVLPINDVLQTREVVRSQNGAGI